MRFYNSQYNIIAWSAVSDIDYLDFGKDTWVGKYGGKKVFEEVRVWWCVGMGEGKSKSSEVRHSAKDG